MPQIAKEMGISIERVRQYKAKGLRCLRCSPLLLQLYRENKSSGYTHAFIQPDMYYLKYFN